MPSPSASVVILAGGQSKRLGGRDKALLQVEQMCLLQRVLGAASGLSDDVLVVVNVPDKYRLDAHVRQVVDAIAAKGPLGGLYTGLSHMRHERCLLLGCDSPFLHERLLRWLMEQRGDFDAVVPRLLHQQDPSEGARSAPSFRYFPLHAVYRRRCLPIVKQLLDQDRLAMRGLLDRVSVHYVEQEALAKLDPTLNTFININTPTDFELAKQRWMANKSGL